jgi:photosystem II stability/assembly factor-like uncharacterized protein
MAIDPQNSATIYATTATGMLKTNNSALRWTAADDGLPRFAYSRPRELSSLVIDPQAPSTIYEADFDHGLFKTIDSGATWSPIAASKESFYGPLTIDPWNPGTLYAAGAFTYSGGDLGGWVVFKSVDAGTTWTYSSFVRNWITVLAIDPQDPNTAYAGASGDLFKSSDGAESWYPLDLPWDSIPPGCEEGWFVGALAVDPRNSSTVYAVVGNDYGGCGYSPFTFGVLKSTDGGASWKMMKSGLPPSPGSDGIALVLDPQDSKTLYVSIAGKVFRSMDGATNWSDVGAGLRGAVTRLALDPKDPSTLFAGTEGGGIFVITFDSSTKIPPA